MKSSKKPVSKPQPSPMVFEHVPVERPYDRIAKRVLAAAAEMNKALQEAHECAEMRVFLATLKQDGESMRFDPQIYNLTHSTVTYSIKLKEADPKMEWRHVKDPAFKDVAGRGPHTLRNKTA